MKDFHIYIVKKMKPSNTFISPIHSAIRYNRSNQFERKKERIKFNKFIQKSPYKKQLLNLPQDERVRFYLDRTCDVPCAFGV